MCTSVLIHSSILYLHSGSAREMGSGQAGGKQLALVPSQAQPASTAPTVGAAPASSNPAGDRTSSAITTPDR